MNNWLFPCFSLLVLVLLAASNRISADAETIPAPCNSLSQPARQQLCARFLADPENTGGQSFAEAVTVGDFKEFKRIMERGENYSGLIVLPTSDIIVPDGQVAVFVRGIVAVIGDPEDPPRINLVGNDGALEPIQLLPDTRIGAEVRSQAFYCWGIEWLISDAPRGGIALQSHFGIVRITHSIFGYTLPLNKEGLHEPYIYILEDQVPGWTIQNSVLIAHNQFINFPDYDYEVDDSVKEIYFDCQSGSRGLGERVTCSQVRDVIIRDNLWRSALGQSHKRSAALPDAAPSPLPFDPTNFHGGIEFVNSAHVTLSGNRVADSDTRMSFVFRYIFDYDPTYPIKDINLQLVNNVVLPEIKATHRQLFFNGLNWDWENLPIEGLVNMTCNPHFEVVTAGTFNDGTQIRVIQDNDNCPANTSRTLTPSTVTVPATTLSAMASTPVTAVAYSSLTPAPASVTATLATSITTMATVSPSPEHNHQASNKDNSVLVYSVSATGAVVGLMAWQLGWMLAYKYSKGNFQRFANWMALFVPYCLHQCNIYIKKDDSEVLLNDINE